MTEREPSAYEVNQAEPEVYMPQEVPVKVEGPIDVRQLPAVAWTVNRFQLSDEAGPTRAVSRNPYRRRLMLMTAGTDTFFFGASNEQVRTRSTAGEASATKPVELFHTEEVWVNNVATETPEVSVVEEMWTN